MWFLKNPWTVAVFGAVLASLVLYYIFGIGRENSSGVSSEKQSGGITAQNVAIGSYQQIFTPPTSTETNGREDSKLGVLPYSVFSLRNEIEKSSSTSLEKEGVFEKYIGLVVKDEGYVLDVDKFSSDAISVSITKNEKDMFSYLSCDFSGDWEKTAASLKIGQKVRFSGVIAWRTVLTMYLKNCALQ
ncbi:MAG: hypothetical protein HYY10_02655 [Candidatus Liptonbacteria bacterium]|nr:hypothetical protein [Candidatus Liptonbacteria bacterium]